MNDTVYFSPFLFGAMWILAYYGMSTFNFFDKKITIFQRFWKQYSKNKIQTKTFKTRVNEIKALNKKAIIEALKYNFFNDYFMAHGKTIQPYKLDIMADRAFRQMQDFEYLDCLNRKRTDLLNINIPN